MPGLQWWWTYRSRLTDNKPFWRLPYLLSALCYPLTLVAFKVSSLSSLFQSTSSQLALVLNTGPSIKVTALYVTVAEVTQESLPQLTLQVPSPGPPLPQVYIVLRTGDCTWPQVIAIGTSLLAACKGEMENYLQDRQRALHNKGQVEERLYTNLPLHLQLSLMGSAFPTITHRRVAEFFLVVNKVIF